jgi:ADP-ribose pyrophosphatase YjhB (NUDIX family)
MQRIAAYAVIRREDAILLTRLSGRAHDTGSWTLPGGGVDHGEPPASALEREVAEECGVACDVGNLLDVHDLHFAGTAPSGRYEDFHGIHLLFAGTVAPGTEPRVVEVDGTTDAVAWVPLADIASGALPVTDVVRAALA